MTCASCVNRIERFVNRVDGVAEATVNLATEQARVAFDPGATSVRAITAAVEAAGYEVAAAPAATAATADDGELDRAAELRALGWRAAGGLAIGLLMMALMFLPTGIPMAILAPALLVAATVVQVWAGGTFYRAAWRAAPPRLGHDGHAGRGRHERRVRVQRLRDALAHGRGLDRSADGHLLRDRGDHRRARAHRSLARGPCTPPDRCRGPSAHAAPAHDGAGRARRRRDRRADRQRARRRPRAGAARRARARRRHGPRGPLRARREHGHRREPAGRQGTRRRRHRGDAERVGVLRRCAPGMWAPTPRSPRSCAS